MQEEEEGALFVPRVNPSVGSNQQIKQFIDQAVMSNQNPLGRTISMDMENRSNELARRLEMESGLAVKEEEVRDNIVSIQDNLFNLLDMIRTDLTLRSSLASLIMKLSNERDVQSIIDNMTKQLNRSIDASSNPEEQMQLVKIKEQFGRQMIRIQRSMHQLVTYMERIQSNRSAMVELRERPNAMQQAAEILKEEDERLQSNISKTFWDWIYAFILAGSTSAGIGYGIKELFLENLGEIFRQSIGAIIPAADTCLGSGSGFWNWVASPACKLLSGTWGAVSGTANSAGAAANGLLVVAIFAILFFGFLLLITFSRLSSRSEFNIGWSHLSMKPRNPSMAQLLKPGQRLGRIDEGEFEGKRKKKRSIRSKKGKKRSIRKRHSKKRSSW